MLLFWRCVKVGEFISHIEVPKTTLLCAMFHEEEEEVKWMRGKLLKFNPNFFSLDDMPRENMAPPMSAEELVNSGADRIKVHPNFVLTLWYTLRQMRKESSFWRPYFDVLPQYIPTPLSWTEEELERIKGTNLYEGLPQLRCLLKKVWNTLNRVDETPYALSDVEYAWTLYTSRSFTVSTDQSRAEVHTHIMKYNQSDSEAASAPALVEPALVPFADLFNHDLAANVRYRTNNVRNSFNLELKTLKQNGQEIFNNYGAKSNESLIVGYGFAILDTDPYPLPSINGSGSHGGEMAQDSENASKNGDKVPKKGDEFAKNGDGFAKNGDEVSKNRYSVRPQKNPHNTYWVQINIDERDSLRSKKLRLLEKRGLTFRHHITADGSLPKELLDAVRICLLDNIELYFLDGALYDSTDLPKGEYDPNVPANVVNGIIMKPGVSSELPPIPTSFEGEMLLFDTLITLLQTRLNKMEETPAGEDRQNFLNALQASNPPLSWPSIIGWQYRVEQKETLEAALLTVERMRIDFLKSPRNPPILESQVLPENWDRLEHLPQEWIERFASWTIDYGDKVPTIERDDLIPVMKVPLEYILCRETIRLSPVGAIMHSCGTFDGLDEELLLAIAILFHLHTPGQPLYEYFQVIAKQYQGRPKYLNAPTYDTTELLEETPAENEISAQTEHYRQLFKDLFLSMVAPIHRNFQDQQMFGWRQFAWAFSIVSAEALMVPVGDESQLGIIPSYGVRKVHPNETCELVSDDEGKAIFVKTSKIFSLSSPNAPISTSNGSSSTISSATSDSINSLGAGKFGFYSGCQYYRNEELLRTYGIIIADHNANVLSLPLYAHEEDDVVDIRMSCLSRLRLNTEHFLNATHAPQQLVSSLKILSMSPPEIKAIYGAILEGETNVTTTTRAAENALVDRLLAIMDTLQRGIKSHEKKKRESNDEWFNRRYDLMIAYKNQIMGVLKHNLTYMHL